MSAATVYYYLCHNDPQFLDCTMNLNQSLNFVTKAKNTSLKGHLQMKKYNEQMAC